MRTTDKGGLYLVTSNDDVIGMRTLAECRCGCGTLVPVASQNWSRGNIKKGDPQYAPGHQNRPIGFDRKAQTKICTRCPKRGPQPLANFHLKAKSPDGYVFVCKACRSLESQSRYATQSEEQREHRRLNHERLQERKRVIVAEHLVSGCKDCDNRDVRVLEFDHVRGDKEADVSRLFVSGSPSRLMDEIAKCEVVCANCLRIRTGERAGWSKARVAA